MNDHRDISILLVLDMVGSTTQRQRLGESRFAEIREHFDTASKRIVATHGGRLVKEQGDGFIAAFGTASDSLDAGVALLQAATTINRRRPPGECVDVRIGISGGEIAWVDGDVTGLVPVEATRLESAAGTNAILCSDLVRILASPDRGHGFVDGRELALKGLTVPVRAWTVDWGTVTTSRQLGLPEPLAVVPRLDFVGRHGEVARLEAAWDATRRGGGQLITVAGEPGAGKTRICREFAQRCLDGDEAIVLYGRCDEVVAAPYQPFVEALQRYADRAPHVDLLPSREAAELARLVPLLREQLPGLGEPAASDSDTQRYRLFDAMADWLRFLAREDPVLLVLDDMTWASDPTLAMLRHVSARLADAAVLCVATYRPQETAPALHDVLASLRREMTVDTVTLGALKLDEVLEALRGLLGDRHIDAAVRSLGSAVWRESGGNPLYVSELFADLLRSGSIHVAEHGWTATVRPEQIRIPAAIGDVVLQRWRPLTPTTQRVVGTAAVAGVSFDPRIVQEVVGVGPDVIAESLAEAEGAGLVRSAAPPRYEFTHALVRDVLYGVQTAYRRAVVHEAIARATETAHHHAVDDYADELAFHFSMAPSPEGAARGVWYGAVAAQRATERFAHGEAVLHYARALHALKGAQLPEHDQVHGRLTVDLGVAQHRAGDPAALRTLLDGSRLAAAAGDGPLCARAVLAGSRGFFSATGSIDDERVAALRSALELIGPSDSRVRAMLLANLSVELGFTGDHGEQDRLSDDATAMARRLDDPGALVPVLGLRLVTFWRADRVRERLALAEELDELCVRYGRPQATLIAATMGCQAAMEAGDFAIADQRLATINEVSAALHQPLSLGYARLRQAMRAAVDGRLDESERLADEAYEFCRLSGQADAKAFWVGQRFHVRYHQGRLDEVIDEVVQAADDFPGIVAFRACLAMVATELGRDELARRALADVFGPEGSGVPDDLNRLTTLAFAAQAAAALDDRELSARLGDELLAFRDQFVDNASTFVGSVERYLALALSTAGRAEEADDAFARAAAAHARLGAPILLARSNLEWAEAQTRRGADDPGRIDAAERFQRALEVAVPLELTTIETRARRGLAALGR